MTKSDKTVLDNLYRQITEISLLHSCAAVLEWDERTYMPAGGGQHRAEQKALLSGMVHEKFTTTAIGELLSKAEDLTAAESPDSPDRVNLRELRRQYDKLIKVPKSLVEELEKTTTLAEQAWVEARRKADTSGFLPWLDKVINLKRQYAEAVGYKAEPYDALLDDYEPGETAANLKKVLESLRPPLVELIRAIADSGRKPKAEVLQRQFPVDKQEIIGKMAAAAIGFDMDCGRLDVTTHPFCIGIGPGDTRITTRYNERHFAQSFFGILHETGHGLYDQGLDKKYFGLPMGESVSLGIHESQSRMWENIVGRSRYFWEYFYPWAQKLFYESLKDVSLDDFYFAINEVRPSFIRVEADEATYNLHILLRFEIEHAIFSGELKTTDIPSVWNDKFEKYLGIKPPDDSQGCLQDVHWGAGLIGYFPTYTLGNLYAAQFFARAKKEMPDLEKQFASGQFSGLLNWLREKIHRQGQKYRAAELVKVVTGEPLNSRYLLDYLRAKYAPLYGI